MFFSRRLQTPRGAVGCDRAYAINHRMRRNSSRVLDEFFKSSAWSVKSMLPGKAGELGEMPAISSTQLDHLLKLSALPPPKTALARNAMLRGINDQLHFVRKAQEVDTRGVEPLRSLIADQAEDEELTYANAVQAGEDMRAQDFTPETDYTKLASRTKNKFYTVDGGLVNPKES